MLEREGKDARALSGVTLAAIVRVRIGELRKHGLRADYIRRSMMPPIWAQV